MLDTGKIDEENKVIFGTNTGKDKINKPHIISLKGTEEFLGDFFSRLMKILGIEEDITLRIDNQGEDLNTIRREPLAITDCQKRDILSTLGMMEVGTQVSFIVQANNF